MWDKVLYVIGLGSIGVPDCDLIKRVRRVDLGWVITSIGLDVNQLDFGSDLMLLLPLHKPEKLIRGCDV